MKRITDRQVAKLLEEILDFQVANRRGSGWVSKFYSCYTFPAGKFPKWVAKAERILAAIKASRRKP